MAVEGARDAGVTLLAAGLAVELDLEAHPGRTYGAEEGVGVSGMGCSGKEGALLIRSVGGSFEEAWSSRLPFYLSARESPWSLFKFWKLSLWVGLIISYYIVELPRALSDTGHKRGEYVRKQKAAAGHCKQTP